MIHKVKIICFYIVHCALQLQNLILGLPITLLRINYRQDLIAGFSDTSAIHVLEFIIKQYSSISLHDRNSQSNIIY